MIRTGIIYKITNPLNHYYIGQSINWNKRYSRYKNLNCKDQPALYNSFTKYGFENHTFEILMHDINEDQLNIWEQIWIWAEDSYENPDHLNLTEGGDGPGRGINNHNYGKSLPQWHKDLLLKNNKNPKSEDHKRKISESEKGKIVSQETKNKLKLSHLGQIPWNKGVPWNNETKQKMSLAKKGKTSNNKGRKATNEQKLKQSMKMKGKPSAKAKKVKCIELNKIFNSIKQTANYFNVSEITLRKILNNGKTKLQILNNYTFEILNNRETL